MKALARVATSRSIKRDFALHPVRLGLAVGEKVRDRSRLRRLRRSYPEEIGSPTETAILRPVAGELAVAAELPRELEDAARRIRCEAESVLEHKVDYLGSGLVQLPREIDWHTDFKSGYKWPCTFYQDVEITRLSDDSDAKVPWELSRGHQLLTLARAARLYEDERFVSELEWQLASWLEQNSAGRGINWVNAMEVAIRAVNWLWAIATAEQWRPLDPALRASVVHSLQVHGRHIAAHLEGSSRLRSNHYLADILGLLALGACLDGDAMAPKWLRFAQRHLEREMVGQVLPDGVGFEASLPYHGLALEMFLLAWFISTAANRPLSSGYRARLIAMLEVSRSVRHPDGRSPVFGDQDSGRILPAGFARPATHDNLLDLGSALLDMPPLVPGPPNEEVAWTLGVEAWRRLAGREYSPKPPTSAFPAGGLYVMQNRDVHLVARWGGVGQNGNGGHGHNDISSYELSYGETFVVDPGTYVYTADPAARNKFRSSSAHNVTVVDGLDMHPVSPTALFVMPAYARLAVESYEQSEHAIRLAGWHDGFRRDGDEIVCHRKISLDKVTSLVEVVDEVRGAGRRRVESLIHLAPGCVAEAIGATEMMIHASERRLMIMFSGADAVTIEEDWVSDKYGSRVRAPVLRAVVSAELPVRLGYRVQPT